MGLMQKKNQESKKNQEPKKLCSSGSPMASCLCFGCLCFILDSFCRVAFSASLWGLQVAVPQLLCPIETLYWRRKWQPTPVLLPGKSHGRRSLVGYSPWGRKESDTTEWLHFPFPFPFLLCWRILKDSNLLPFLVNFILLIIIMMLYLYLGLPWWLPS